MLFCFSSISTCTGLELPFFYHYFVLGNELEGKKTAAPLRKPHGAGLFSLHGLLTAKDMLQEERETQMDVYV